MILLEKVSAFVYDKRDHLLKQYFFFIGLILCLNFTAQAQDVFDDYSFFRNQNIPILHETNSLSMPWAGGMNGVRFSEIDLNNDGVLDLIAFEKHGNRLLPFLRVNNHYTYAPEYIHCFPSVHDWMILKDYNNDGKPDLFTYGVAGITVYQNISNSQLQFRLVTEQLQAFYYNGYVNVYASPDDYLVIEDIDHDGHLDLLNFWILGKYVHHLRNYSDNPELFDFRLESECWGHFEEAADNNTILLFSDCNRERTCDQPMRHVGSSMVLHDFDNNSLPDLLLGDVDSPNLILLYNHGTLQEAAMTHKDTAFPTHAPIQLYSMPAPSLITLPTQSHPSLIASPSDPSLTKSQDLNSVWRYDYNPLLEQYTLTNTAFLQEEMIDVGSGAYPILYDWNNDGLLDLFIANYGSFDSAHVVQGLLTSYFSSSIHYYQNVGTESSPIFQLINEDFGNLKTLNLQALYPTFGDFDGDGEVDMLCGQKDGTLLLIPHQRLIHGTGNILPNYQNIDVGNFSTPTYFDIDHDGKQDLIIGNQRGLLSYYRNIGTGEDIAFEWITDSLGNVSTRNHDQSYFGYSVPCFYRDPHHGTILLCGSEQGNIFYYKDIDNHLNESFNFAGFLNHSENETCHFCATPLREGKRSGIAIGQLTHQSYPDLLVGNYAGGVAFFQGRTPTQHGSHLANHDNQVQVFPNPTTDLVHISDPSCTIFSIDVYDLFGKLLIHAPNKTSVDLRSLPSGIYFIELNHCIRKKIIKQ